MGWRLTEAWVNTRHLWPQLPSGASEIVHVLCHYAPNGKPLCWPNNETLAKQTGLTPRSVQRNLRLLEKLGIIRRLDGPQGLRYFSLQPILDSYTEIKLEEKNTTDVVGVTPASGGVTPASGGVTPASGGGDASVMGGVTPVSPEPEIEPVNEPRDINVALLASIDANNATSVSEGASPNGATPPTPPPTTLSLQSNQALCKATTSKGRPCQNKPTIEGYCRRHAPAEALERADPYAQDFEEFWQAYPRKVAKDAARRAYGRLRKQGVGRLALLWAAMNFAHWELAMNRTEEKYIPHPATWLNQGRYKDEHLHTVPFPVQEEWGYKIPHIPHPTDVVKSLRAKIFEGDESVLCQLRELHQKYAEEYEKERYVRRQAVEGHLRVL